MLSLGKWKGEWSRDFKSIKRNPIYSGYEGWINEVKRYVNEVGS